MEADFLKQYQAAWKQDADRLLDKVAPPVEELLAEIERRERQRRSRRTTFLSGIAAMVVLAVALFFVIRPASQPVAPTVAANTEGQQPSPSDGMAIGGGADTLSKPQARPALLQPSATKADRAMAVPHPQSAPAHNHADAAKPGAPDHYRDSRGAVSNFEVAYLDEYHLDSVHNVPATIITARDSAAWEWLRTQFALAPEAAGRGEERFVQRSSLPSALPATSFGLDTDTDSYLLGVLPHDQAIVVIRYEALPDLLDRPRIPTNYVENDTLLPHKPHRAKQKMPEENEKMPNRHNVRVETPTYYQAITPSGQPINGYRR